MSERTHLAIYRRFVRCYPRPFRDEYGPDLLATFAQQLRDLGAARCWLRTTRDAAVTVPAQHLERHMKSPSTRTVGLGAGAIGAGATLAAIVTGASLYALLLLILASGALLVAVWARRDAAPVDPLVKRASWKWLLFSGVALLGTIVVMLNLPSTSDDDLSEPVWSLMMASFLTSFVLIAAGVVLGAAQLANRRR